MNDDRCHFQPLEGDRCTSPGDLHVLAFDPIGNPTSTVTCREHALLTPKLGTVYAAHRVGRHCGQPGSVWTLTIYGVNECRDEPPTMDATIIGAYAVRAAE